MIVSALQRGTHSCPAPFMIAERSSRRRPVLDGADDRRENGTRDAATSHLADNAADIRRRGGISKPRICPPTPPPTAPARVFPSVPRSIFLAAPAAAFPPMAPLTICMIRLMSKPDMMRYSPIRYSVCALCMAPDHRRALQLKRLHREGHAAAAKDSGKKCRDRL